MTIKYCKHFFQGKPGQKGYVGEPGPEGLKVSGGSMHEIKCVWSINCVQLYIAVCNGMTVKGQEFTFPCKCVSYC